MFTVPFIAFSSSSVSSCCFSIVSEHQVLAPSGWTAFMLLLDSLSTPGVRKNRSSFSCLQATIADLPSSSSSASFSPLLLPQRPFFHSSPTSATLLLCLSFVYNPSTLPLFCPKPFFLASPSLPTLLLLLPPFAAPSLLCCCPCSGAW